MNKDTELTQEEFEKLDQILCGFVGSIDRLIIISKIESSGFRISDIKNGKSELPKVP